MIGPDEQVDRLRLETITDEDSFRALSEEWDEVLARSRHDGPFLQHSWASSWWEVFGGERQLHVVTLRDEGRLAGVLPLYTMRTGRMPKATAARLLGDTDVGSTSLGPFALPGVEDDAFGRFAAYMGEHDAGFDVFDLRFLQADHPFLRHLENHPRSSVSEDRGRCPLVALPQDWEAYLKTLSKHMRHEVRRSQRRVSERGFEFEVLRDPADLDEAFDDFIRLHESRMRTKQDSDYSVSPEYREFTTRTMRRLLAEDRLRLRFATKGGRRVAVLYAFRHGDTIYAEQSGFDETDARQDVLRTLWAETIRAAIEEGCTTLDMLLGDQRYKRDWGVTSVRYLSHLQAYNLSFAGIATLGRHRLLELFRKARAREATAAPAIEGDSA